MCLNYHKLVHKHPAHLVSPSLQGIEGMQGALCTSLTRLKHIEPHRTFSNGVLTEIARYIDFFHTSSGWFDWTKSSLTPSLPGIQGVQGAICTSSMRFKQVQARCGEVCHMSSMCLNHPELVHKHPAHLVSHRTSSNLHDPHHHRNSKVCRGLSHEFGVVRLYRTFTMYIVTGETRSAVCLCNSSGWFKHIEPHRTYKNHIITAIARCEEVYHMRSGWFDCTEPSLCTLLQECRVLMQ